MNSRRLLATAALATVVAYAAVLWSGAAATPVVKDIVASFIPQVMGLLIGAVGVFLGGLGGLYGVLVGASRQSGNAAASQNIATLAREMRHNTLFALAGLGCIIGLRLFAVMDIPGLAWPLSSPLLTKAVVSDSLMLAVASLTLYAVWDSVAAMFTIYKQYEIALEAKREDRA